MIIYNTSVKKHVLCAHTTDNGDNRKSFYVSRGVLCAHTTDNRDNRKSFYTSRDVSVNWCL